MIRKEIPMKAKESLSTIDLDELDAVTGGARQSHELQKLQAMGGLLGAVASMEKNQTDLQAAQMQAQAAMYGADKQAQASMTNGMFGMMGSMMNGMMNMGGGGGGGSGMG
jgi:hypothetical protein